MVYTYNYLCSIKLCHISVSKLKNTRINKLFSHNYSEECSKVSDKYLI